MPQGKGAMMGGAMLREQDRQSTRSTRTTGHQFGDGHVCRDSAGRMPAICRLENRRILKIRPGPTFRWNMGIWRF